MAGISRTLSRVRVTRRPDALGDGGGDERTVGGEDHAAALFARIGRQVQQVRPGEGLATGEEDDRAPEVREPIDDAAAFLGRQFLGDIRLTGRIAVLTLEVAALGDVPDDDGLLIPRELQQMARQVRAQASVTQGVRGLGLPHVELGNTNHGQSFGKLSTNFR